MSNIKNKSYVELDIGKIKKDAIEVVREAAKLFADRKAAENTFEKGACDYVTKVDSAVQSFIQEKLYALYPEILFLSEEKDNSDVDIGDILWVLDPVDGTTNLIYDYKMSAISLALLVGGKPIFGVVYNPYSDEMFSAMWGEGSYLNGKRIYCRKPASLSESLIAIGTTPYHKEEADEIFELFKRLFKDGRDLRRSGSAALDLAHVAAGRLDLYLEKRLKIWDYAAGTLIVREAGGVVCDYAGNERKMDMVGDVIAGCEDVVLEVVERYL